MAMKKRTRQVLICLLSMVLGITLMPVTAQQAAAKTSPNGETWIVLSQPSIRKRPD